jgi:hypothetical protein
MDGLSRIQQEQLDRVNEIIDTKIACGYDAFNQATGGKLVPHENKNVRLNPFSAAFLEKAEKDLIKQRDAIRDIDDYSEDTNIHHFPLELQKVNRFKKLHRKAKEETKAARKELEKYEEELGKPKQKEMAKKNKEELADIKSKLAELDDHLKSLKDEAEPLRKSIEMDKATLDRLIRDHDELDKVIEREGRTRELIKKSEDELLKLREEIDRLNDVIPTIESEEEKAGLLEQLHQLNARFQDVDNFMKMKEIELAGHNIHSLVDDQQAIADKVDELQHTIPGNETALKRIIEAADKYKKDNKQKKLLKDKGILEHKLEIISHKKKNLQQNIIVAKTKKQGYKLVKSMKPKIKERKLKDIDRDIKLLKLKKKAIKHHRGGVQAGLHTELHKERSWQAHLRHVRKENPDMPYKKVQALASSTYHSKALAKTIKHHKEEVKKVHHKGGVRAGVRAGKGASHQKTAHQKAAHYNPWIMHVQAYRAKHPHLSYKEVLMQARKSYK